MISAKLLLLPALCCMAVAVVPPGAAAPPPIPPPAAIEQGSPLSLADEQYQRAVQIRDTQDASQRELKHAVKLLYSAAGIQHLSLERGNGSSVSGGQPKYLTASSVRLVLRNDTVPHLGALKELVFVYREGDGVPVNPAIAHRLLLLLAELGSAEAQADIAFHLALGVEPVAPNPRDQLFRLVPPDLPAALVHYAVAARSGDGVAQLTLGYRHLQGIDVPRSCQTAVMYYAPVAEKVLEMAQLREGLPQIRNVRLSYKSVHTWRPSREQEVMHYQWFADFGNPDAARAVAQVLSTSGARDYAQAIRYLRQAASAGDADAMAHLGNIHANGLGVPQDNQTAMSWFWKAAERGHAGGYFGLGYMYMSGHGTARDYGKALRYLQDASQAAGMGAWPGGPDVFFCIGLMHLRGWGTRVDISKAAQLWDTAARGGHLLAAYNLAMLHLGGHTRSQAPCQDAALLLKKVAERGFPAPQEAYEDFQAGDYEWSLLNYLKAAEMGHEPSQSNAAWMFTEGYGYEGPEAGGMALALYKRAAAQGNHAALLRIGDGYWYGRGVPRDWRRAGQMYGEAGKHGSAQALFNLGFMHQFGAGLPKDPHLAKRSYDRAMALQPDASLAVHAALALLRFQGWWEGVESRLPRRLAAPVSGLFALLDHGAAGRSSAAPSPLPHHASPVRRGVWPRLRALLSPWSLFDALDDLFELGNNVDVTVAVALLLMLALVLWRRRTLRNQNLARQFVQAQPAAAAARARTQPQQQAEQPRGAAPQPGAAVPMAVPIGAGPAQGGTAGEGATNRTAAAGGSGDGTETGASGSGSAAPQAPNGLQREAGGAES